MRKEHIQEQHRQVGFRIREPLADGGFDDKKQNKSRNDDDVDLVREFLEVAEGDDEKENNPEEAQEQEPAPSFPLCFSEEVTVKSFKKFDDDYLTRLIMSNMGKNMAMTMRPMAPPMATTMSGSMSADRAPTVSSTMRS